MSTLDWEFLQKVAEFVGMDTKMKLCLLAGAVGAEASDDEKEMARAIGAALRGTLSRVTPMDRGNFVCYGDAKAIRLRPCHWGVPLEAAAASAEKEDDPDWRQLIKKHPRWRAGFRQLNFAVWQGLADIVKLMLRDDHLGPSDYDNTALQSAVDYEHDEIVRMLLADGRFDPTIDRYYAVVVAAEKESRADILEALCTDNRVNIQMAIKRAKKDGYPRSVTDRLRKYIF